MCCESANSNDELARETSLLQVAFDWLVSIDHLSPANCISPLANPCDLQVEREEPSCCDTSYHGGSMAFGVISFDRATMADLRELTPLSRQWFSDSASRGERQAKKRG